MITLVLGTSTGGVGTHVASLARNLPARGWAVRVCGPQSTDDLFGFRDSGVEFVPVHIAGPIRDLPAVAALRRATNGAAMVHAHGLRAGTVAALSRRGARRSTSR